MACRQTWKVEAVRDGRLASPDSEVIAIHLKTCGSCAAEAARLEQVGEALRAIPVREPSQLVVRIGRRRLLEEATRAASPGRSSPSGLRARAVPFRVVLDAAAVFLLVWVGLRHAPWKSTSPDQSSAPTADSSEAFSGLEVRASAEARWSQRSEPTVRLIALDQGTLWTRIAHDKPRPRVMFQVPDGQIEDVGTTFTVVVQGGRTKRVAVEEGAVVIRVRGLQPIPLGAGTSWERSDDSSARDNAQGEVTAAAASNPPAADTTVANPSAPMAAAPTAPAPEATPAVVEPRPAPAPAAAKGKVAKPRRNSAENPALKRASSALRAGRYDEAARLYEKFAANHPNEPSAEDASYLRVLSLEKADRHEEARAAAELYLARFPEGFRRTELEAFVANSRAH